MRPSIMSVAAASALIACQAHAAPPTQSEIAPLVKAMLQRFLDEPDFFPDSKLVETRPTRLRIEISDGLKVEPQMLPHPRRWRLEPEEKFEKEAETRKRPIYYAVIDSIE